MTSRQTAKPPFSALIAVFATAVFLALAPDAGAQTCRETLSSASGEIPHRPSRVIRDGASAYGSDTASTPTGSLRFDTMLTVEEVRRGRVKVSNSSGSGPVTWMDPADLLCSTRPLRDKGRGPELKFFIRAPISVRTASPREIAAYRGPSMPRIAPDQVTAECGPSSCQPIYRGSGLFIFSRLQIQIGGQKRERLLVGPSQSLDGNGTRLIGWVDAEDGFIWSTAYGIRPAENLTYSTGPQAGKERPVCAYRTEPGARHPVDSDPCIPILGGARWYQLPVRIPVLSSVRDADGTPTLYRIVLNVAGQGIDRNRAEGWDLQTPFSPDTAATGARIPVDEFAKLKQSDVFFIIDGTKSMEAHMDAVRDPRNGAIKKIATELQKLNSHLQSHYRFGALIYRDAAAGNLELELMKFPNSCDGPSGAEELIEKLSKVTAADIGNDTDFPENSFGGISHALKYLRSNCPDRNKIVIVIGDHGYDAAAQQERGRAPVDIGTIIELLKKGNGDRGRKRAVPIFVQAPSIADKVVNAEDYRRSYDLFLNQAHAIIEGSIGFGAPRELVLSLDSKSLGKQVLDIVGNYSDSSAVVEVERRVLGGESLVQAIEKAQGDPRFRNIPGLFWEIVKDGACKALGNGCERQTYDVSMEAYLPVSNDIRVDVHMTRQQLINQISQLDGFLKEFVDLNDEQRREQVRKAMTNSLTAFMGRPSYDGSETVDEFLTREYGLPIRERSPLLHYKSNDMANPAKVENCELARILGWAEKSKTLLLIAGENDRPIVRFLSFPGKCEGGRRTIPHVDGEIGREPFPAKAGYRSSAGGSNEEPHFWIPQEYLP